MDLIDKYPYLGCLLFLIVFGVIPFAILFPLALIFGWGLPPSESWFNFCGK
jgi:hypothetical protein